jgi:ketosteroid isomerase-like protein
MKAAKGWHLVGSIVLLLMVAPGRSYGEDAPGPAPDMGTTWAAHWSRHELDETLALYTSDAVFFTPDDRVTGTMAIRGLFRVMLDTYQPTIHMHRTLFEQSGHLAHESGDYEETLVASGQKTSVRGHYLLVLRMEGGRWLIVEQMWTGPRVP